MRFSVLIPAAIKQISLDDWKPLVADLIKNNAADLDSQNHLAIQVSKFID